MNFLTVSSLMRKHRTRTSASFQKYKSKCNSSYTMFLNLMKHFGNTLRKKFSFLSIFPLYSLLFTFCFVSLFSFSFSFPIKKSTLFLKSNVLFYLILNPTWHIYVQTFSGVYGCTDHITSR